MNTGRLPAQFEGGRTDEVVRPLTLVESLTSICASSFPLMLKLQKRPRS